MDKLITYVGLDVSAGMTRCDLLLRIGGTKRNRQQPLDLWMASALSTTP